MPRFTCASKTIEVPHHPLTHALSL
jgi:hypothetical protein